MMPGTLKLALLAGGVALATAFLIPPTSLARAPTPANKLPPSRSRKCALAVMSAEPLRLSRRALAFGGLPAALLLPGLVQAQEEDKDLARIREGCEPCTKHTTNRRPAAWSLDGNDSLSCRLSEGAMLQKRKRIAGAR